MQGSFKAVLATMLLVGLAAREAAYADEPTCQQLDRAVVERVLIAAKADPNDPATRLALNRAHHRLTVARIDCKAGRIERARARYAQALDELLGLPPALADASISDADAP
ncbi:MAG TPA: hypothetical protein VJ924_01800 [Alphaproteobacteria bacterium]|nr:hypothetical protein [Alphaproteobacteria bacterium]